jgi:hypothetical protein
MSDMLRQELYRVHFQDVKVIHEPGDGQGPLHLDMQICKTITEEWNPYKGVINQVNIGWITGTYKKIKLE